MYRIVAPQPQIVYIAYYQHCFHCDFCTLNLMQISIMFLVDNRKDFEFWWKSDFNGFYFFFSNIRLLHISTVLVFIIIVYEFFTIQFSYTLHICDGLNGAAKRKMDPLDAVESSGIRIKGIYILNSRSTGGANCGWYLIFLCLSLSIHNQFANLVLFQNVRNEKCTK